MDNHKQMNENGSLYYTTYKKWVKDLNVRPKTKHLETVSSLTSILGLLDSTPKQKMLLHSKGNH